MALMSEPGPAEWSQRYEVGSTPWDLGRPHPELIARLPGLGPPGAVIVPGAGRGHDAAVLAAAGWTVTAIDFAPALEAELHDAVGDGGRVVICDVFEFHPREPVDLVIDHTFFCAIPLHLRDEFGRWSARVVRTGGTVASIVFPVGRSRAEGGPPYGMSVDDLAQALGPRFDLEIDEPAINPAGRSWSARWAAFRRRGRREL